MRSPTWNFIQHFLEMMVSMFVGMFALGMPVKALFESLGWSFMNEVTEPRTLVMATNMTIGMTVWMRIRGCGWRACGEMGLAMYLSFAVMYPFYWAGLVSSTAVMVVGHVVMVPAMLGAMLLRREEYSHSHREHRQKQKQQEEIPA